MLRSTFIILCAALLLHGTVAQWDPPVSPALDVDHNIVIFPDRDFITIEGFEESAGKKALVQVHRAPPLANDNPVVGEAVAVIQVGDGVAFEVNHPGAVCWGNHVQPIKETSDKWVTPDIRAGDYIAVGLEPTAGYNPSVAAFRAVAQVLDIHVLGKYRPFTNTMIVHGHVGSGVIPANLEQRIINPDLDDTTVGRRDLRATPTAATEAGYSSVLEVNPTEKTWKATYTFTDLAAADLAFNGGGERIMAWKAVDGDDNRLAITISEFGEAGGPGMGGCPMSPIETPPPPPELISSSTAPASAEVKFTAAQGPRGGTAIIGYEVRLVAGDGTPVWGKRVGSAPYALEPPDGFDGNYTVSLRGAPEGLETGFAVEVRSISGTNQLSSVAKLAPSGGGRTPAEKLRAVEYPTGGETAAQAVPAVTVSLLSPTPDAEIYFTVDGTPPFKNTAFDGAQLVTEPIPVAPSADGTIDPAPPAPPALAGRRLAQAQAPAGTPLPAGVMVLRWVVIDPLTDTNIIVGGPRYFRVAGPLALDDRATAVVKGPITISVLANDQTQNLGALNRASVKVTSAKEEGVTTDVGPTGVITFTSQAAGAKSFKYTVANANGVVSNEATVAVTVNPAPTQTVTISSAVCSRGAWTVRGTVTPSLGRQDPLNVVSVFTVDAAGNSPVAPVYMGRSPGTTYFQVGAGGGWTMQGTGTLAGNTVQCPTGTLRVRAVARMSGASAVFPATAPTAG